MTRRRFPLVDVVVGVPETGALLGAPALLPHGLVLGLFADEAGTIPLDATDLDGNPIDSVIVDGVTIPSFLGPDDGSTVVYAKAVGQPSFAVETADVEQLAYEAGTRPTGEVLDEILPGKVVDPADPVGEALLAAGVTKWEPGDPGLIITGDRFFSYADTSADVASELTEFFADTSIKGTRRLWDHRKAGSTVVIPAGVAVNGARGSVEQLTNNTRLFQVGAGAILERVTAIGKTTDYAPAQGSPSGAGNGQKTGFYIGPGSDRAELLGCVADGFAESGIQGIGASDVVVDRFTSFGVHGRPAAPGAVGDWIVGGDIVIPFVDARCRGITGSGGAVRWTVTNYRVEDSSIGAANGIDTHYWTWHGVRGRNIKGQHLLYVQGVHGTHIIDVFGESIAINVVKVQLTSGSADDVYGLVVAGVTGIDADNVFMMTNTAIDAAGGTPPPAWTHDTTYGPIDSTFPSQVTNDGGKVYEVSGGALGVVGTSASTGPGPAGTADGQIDGGVTWDYIGIATPKEFRSANVSGLSGTRTNRLAYFDSAAGLIASGLAGYGIKKEAVTLKRLRGAELSDIDLEGYGWTGMYLRPGGSAGNERIRVRGYRAHNPDDTAGNPSSGAITAAIYHADPLASKLQVEDFDLSADNGNLDFGIFATTAAAPALPSTGFRRGEISGYSQAPVKFQTKPAGLRTWDRIDMGDTAPVNFPDSRPAGTGPYVGPGENAYIGATYDPKDSIANLSPLTPGVLFAARITVATPGSMGTLRYTTGAAAVGATTGACWMGIYDGVPGGALLASTADLAATWAGAAGDKATALAVAAAGRAVGSYVYVVFLFNGTTGPTIRGNSASGKANMGASTSRFATGGSALTTLPSTLPTLTDSAIQPFVGIKS